MQLPLLDPKMLLYIHAYFHNFITSILASVSFVCLCGHSSLAMLYLVSCIPCYLVSYLHKHSQKKDCIAWSVLEWPCCPCSFEITQPGFVNSSQLSHFGSLYNYVFHIATMHVRVPLLLSTSFA